jgi:hypothetical protein
MYCLLGHAFSVHFPAVEQNELTTGVQFIRIKKPTKARKFSTSHFGTHLEINNSQKAMSFVLDT